MKKLNVVLMGAALLLTACGGAKESAEEAKVMKLGGIGPLTGPLAIYGVTSTNGSKLAFEEINKNGGILGKQVEYIVLDEKGDSTEAVTAYNKLVDEGVVALIGDITSKPSLAVAEVAAQDNLPMITPTGTQFNITEAGPNVFRVCFTDPYQGVVLANFAKNNLNAETAAVVVNNSSDYSDGVAKTLDASAYGAVENSYFTNHYSLQDQSPKVQNFLKAYKEAYNEEPSAFSALSYDAAYMMKAAIEKAGTTDKQAVVDALKTLDYDGVTGHLTFDENNNPVKAVTVLKIVNGEYTFDSVVEPAK